MFSLISTKDMSHMIWFGLVSFSTSQYNPLVIVLMDAVCCGEYLRSLCMGKSITLSEWRLVRDFLKWELNGKVIINLSCIFMLHKNVTIGYLGFKFKSHNLYEKFLSTTIIKHCNVFIHSQIYIVEDTIYCDIINSKIQVTRQILPITRHKHAQYCCVPQPGGMTDMS